MFSKQRVGSTSSRHEGGANPRRGLDFFFLEIVRAAEQERKGLESEGQLGGRWWDPSKQRSQLERPVAMQKQPEAPVALSVCLFLLCATTLAQRTCCDLRGIPLANNTLNCKHLGPGNWWWFLMHLLFPLWTLLIAHSYHSIRKCHCKIVFVSCPPNSTVTFPLFGFLRDLNNKIYFMSLSLGFNHIFKNRGIEISFFSLSKYAVSKKGLCLLSRFLSASLHANLPAPLPPSVLGHRLPAPPPHVGHLGLHPVVPQPHPGTQS